MAEKKKLGEMLIEKGLIDSMQLEAALGRQKQWGGRLGRNLIRLGFISEITLLKFLSSQLNFPCADLFRIRISKDACSLVPANIAKKYNVIPLQTKERGGKRFLFLGMSDPTDLMATDEIRFIPGFIINPVIATDSQIERAIEKYYDHESKEIEPLQEKVPAIKQEEMEIIHEVPLKEQLMLQKAKNIKARNPELMALIRILEKKGLITKDEYDKELKQLKG